MGETVYSRVKLLCKEKGVSIAQMERDIGFQRGNAYKWKDINPSMPSLAKLSSYFNKPISYILKGVDEEERDEAPVDVKTELNRLLILLKDNSDLVFAGDLLNDLSKQILIDNIQHTINIADKCQNA
nr:MAG TPA: LAMBDA REPRESSOR (TRIPLE MUTANT)/DNA COMPLEX-DNA COMPLEX, DOUBLE HELIX, TRANSCRIPTION-DNA.1A [Caudoviricetes sp.]